MVGLKVKTSEIAKEVRQFHVFFALFSTIFFIGSSKAILQALFDESESILFKQFFINLSFDFRVSAQKCRKPCVNGVLKIQFFFLNLSSKVLAGVGVRTSKYTYMDICVPTYCKPCANLALSPHLLIYPN